MANPTPIETPAPVASSVPVASVTPASPTPSGPTPVSAVTVQMQTSPTLGAYLSDSAERLGRSSWHRSYRPAEQNHPFGPHYSAGAQVTPAPSQRSGHEEIHARSFHARLQYYYINSVEFALTPLSL